MCDAPDAEWSTVAPTRKATFEIHLEPDTMVIVIAGCDINAVQVKEQITGERLLLAEIRPLAE